MIKNETDIRARLEKHTFFKEIKILINIFTILLFHTINYLNYDNKTLTFFINNTFKIRT